MKITAKPLKGDTFEVEVEPEEEVKALKAKISAAKPEFPADQTKLIYSGKILTDDQLIKDCGIKPGEFVVVMVSKPKPAAAAPAPAPAPAATPATPAPAEPAAAPAPAAPTSYDASASALVTGSGMDSTISSLMEMGFEREQCERCLAAAFNNPDRAVEYLMSGIPEGVLPPAGAAEGAAGAPPPAAAAPTPAAAPAPAGASPFPAMPTGGSSPGAFPAMPTGGGGGGGGGAGAAALQELRNHPRFAELAAMVQQNPQMLAQILPALSQSNPGLVQAIHENPDEFMRILQDGAGGGGGPPMDPVATMLAAAQQAQAGGMPGGLPPGTHVVQLSQAERDAVDRLAGLGFDRQQALQAYLACDKNEELAANFLFDAPMEED